MPIEDENLKRLACVVGGGVLGALVLKIRRIARRGG
jgi:hypothetical protein